MLGIMVDSNVRYAGANTRLQGDILLLSGSSSPNENPPNLHPLACTRNPDVG
jgi:hypothetical protein